MLGTSSNTSSQARRSRQGFTLVELLVVIGIIALLISILLPALNKARQSANQTKCMANLRSVGQALFIYTTMHKGTLPFGFCEADTNFYGPGGLAYKGPQEQWDTLVLYATSSNRSGAQYANATTGTPGSRGIFICPEVSIETTSSNSRLTHFSAHPVLFPNMQGEGRYAYLTTNPRRIQGLKVYKLSDIKRSAEIAGIFDGSIENTQWGAYALAFAIHGGAGAGRVPAAGGSPTYLIEDFNRTGVVENLDTPVDMTPWTNPGTVNGDFTLNQGNIRFRHGGDTRANALMMDGHVQTFSFNKRKPVTAATDMTLRNILVPPNN